MTMVLEWMQMDLRLIIGLLGQVAKIIQKHEQQVLLVHLELELWLTLEYVLN